jgi:hypothetical protein
MVADSPRIGSHTASEIYSAVGMALSWWESSEDMLLGLFKSLNDSNPDRVKSYIKATRNVRSQMLDKDLISGSNFFNPGEVRKLPHALDSLKDMVTRRNQISHGHCSNLNFSENGIAVMSGHFLVPAYNELGPSDRTDEMRFALSADDINEFIRVLRIHRGVVMDAYHAIMMRAQDARLRAEGREPIYSHNGGRFWEPF